MLAMARLRVKVGKGVGSATYATQHESIDTGACSCPGNNLPNPPRLCPSALKTRRPIGMLGMLTSMSAQWAFMGESGVGNVT